MVTGNIRIRSELSEAKPGIGIRLGYSVLYAVLIVVAALQLFPLVWLLFFSLKNNQEVFNLPPLSLPMNPRWENYEKVWSAGNIDVYFLTASGSPFQLR